MSEPEEKTFEARKLDQHPSVREAVLNNEEFQRWKSGLPTLTVDAVLYYIHWGDALRDEDQIVYEWAVRQGLLPGVASGPDEHS